MKVFLLQNFSTSLTTGTLQTLHIRLRAGKMRRLFTKMTGQSCPLCYELDEGSGLEYRLICCHEDATGEGQY